MIQEMLSKVVIQGLPMQTGGLYTIANDNGSFSIAKLLAFDAHGVHISIFSNLFKLRPVSKSAFNEACLTFKGLTDEMAEDETLGQGHLPVSHQTFNFWDAQFLQMSQIPITEDEMEGYKAWQVNEGGYF